MISNAISSVLIQVWKNIWSCRDFLFKTLKILSPESLLPFCFNAGVKQNIWYWLPVKKHELQMFQHKNESLCWHFKKLYCFRSLFTLLVLTSAEMKPNLMWTKLRDEVPWSFQRKQTLSTYLGSSPGSFVWVWILHYFCIFWCEMVIEFITMTILPHGYVDCIVLCVL